MKKKLFLLFIMIMMVSTSSIRAGEFTRADRERLIQFTTLTLGVIGFAYWDRRTIIRKAKEETIEQLEREGKLRQLIEAMRELARKDKKVAQILRQFNLL